VPSFTSNGLTLDDLVTLSGTKSLKHTLSRQRHQDLLERRDAAALFKRQRLIDRSSVVHRRPWAYVTHT
jgi:hypothetical protein